ncbi:hypothetical protein XA68_11751 [Ophiocordyceps unilateralis]|uniref:Uncharacterized protein n=1 Tax=Ophiocordyceps unilateralis TaxID=268505 RepID=A0A2A9PEN6_OPHUN|nr:hypothetical protein XA68_11751 [Ophiocordyceps unilateralis]
MTLHSFPSTPSPPLSSPPPRSSPPLCAAHSLVTTPSVRLPPAAIVDTRPGLALTEVPWRRRRHAHPVGAEIKSIQTRPTPTARSHGCWHAIPTKTGVGQLWKLESALLGLPRVGVGAGAGAGAGMIRRTLRPC